MSGDELVRGQGVLDGVDLRLHRAQRVTLHGPGVTNLPNSRSGTIHRTAVPMAVATPIHSHPWLPTEITPVQWTTLTAAMARKKGAVR